MGKIYAFIVAIIQNAYTFRIRMPSTSAKATTTKEIFIKYPAHSNKFRLRDIVRNK